MMIIDFHGHCGIQHNTNYKIPEIINYLNDSPVKIMVISSLSSIVSNDYAARELSELNKNPLFIPTFWVNPYYKEWQKDLESFQFFKKIKGIKLHPTANIYEPTKKLLNPVFEYCRKKHIFITIHTDTYRSSPSKITELIIDYPDVNVILLHMDDPINSIFLAKRFSNVYLETSWVERKWKNLAPLKIALDAIDNNKIFFGSDFPFEFPLHNHKSSIGTSRNYEEIIDTYLELLPGEISKQILYSNAKSFLKLYQFHIND